MLSIRDSLVFHYTCNLREKQLYLNTFAGDFQVIQVIVLGHITREARITPFTQDYLAMSLLGLSLYLRQY